MPEVVLQMEGINKTFPGVRALSNMSIDLRRGEVHAVCGENADALHPTLAGQINRRRQNPHALFG